MAGSIGQIYDFRQPEMVNFGGLTIPIELARQLGYKDPKEAGQAKADKAWEDLQALTSGRAKDIDTDPQMAAALEALSATSKDKPTRVGGPSAEQIRSNAYSGSTDLSAAQAGAAAEMLRQQMAQAGISLNDPAAQDRLRSIESSRQQTNQTGLRESQQMGNAAEMQIAQMNAQLAAQHQSQQASAAAQAAQLRLQQMGMVQGANNQGAQYLAAKDWSPPTNAPAGYTPQVQQPQQRSQPQTSGDYQFDSKFWAPKKPFETLYAGAPPSAVTPPAADPKAATTYNLTPDAAINAAVKANTPKPATTTPKNPWWNPSPIPWRKS